MSQSYALTTCIHQHTSMEHLFKNSWCKDTSLGTKIAIVVFHIFTLCIPLIIYKIASSCDPHFLSRLSFSPVVQDLPEQRIAEAKPITEQALAFAQEQIQQPQQQNPRFSLRADLQPVDPEIIPLAFAYEQAIKEFNQIVALLPPNQAISWASQGSVQTAAHRCIRLAYAFSIRTLKDWPQCQKKAAERGEALTFIDFLNTHYPRGYFFDVAKLYYMARGDFRWVLLSPFRFTAKSKEWQPNHIIPQDVVSSFYQPGTVPNEWRILYNSFCDQLRLTKDTLAPADQQRLNNWQIGLGLTSRLDMGTQSFKMPRYYHWLVPTRVTRS